MQRTPQSIINLYCLTLAIARQPFMHKANVLWKLEKPLNFQIINRASVLARMLDNEEVNLDKIDQVKIALASLRHFARCIETYEVGYGEIKETLKINTEVNVEEIKQLVREQVKNEHMRKPMRVDQIIARRTELETRKIEEAEARKRQNMALVDEVYFLCNASDIETFEHGVREDAQAVDWDEYGYVLESKLETIVRPLHTMRKHAIAVHDGSCISDTIKTMKQARAQIEQIMQDAGIDFAKLEAEDQRAEEAMLAADEHFANQEIDAEAVMALADETMPETPVPEPEQTPHKMRRVSAAAAARMAEDTAAQQEARKHAAEEEVRKRQQKAARAAKAAGSQVTSL